MQTTVTDRISATPKPGSLTVPLHMCEIVTVIATGNIYPGRWVGKDSADAVGEGGHPDAAAEVTTTGYGIALYDSARAATGGDHLYVAGDAVPVLKRGRCMISTETDMAFGAAAYVRHTANDPVGANEGMGKFREDVGGGDADAAPTVRVEGVITAAGIVEASINLP